MRHKLIILWLILVSGVCILLIYRGGIVWEKEMKERKKRVDERNLEHALCVSLLDTKLLAIDVFEENANASIQNIKQKLHSETFFIPLYYRGVEEIWLNENMVPWAREGDYEIALNEPAIKVKNRNGQYYEMTFNNKLIKGETEGVKWIEYP